MRSLGRVATRVGLFASLVLVASRARAGETGARADESVRHANVDTTYGRLEGDLGLSIGLGATFGPSAPRGTIEVRLRYLDTVGIYGEYEDGLGAADSNPRRVFGTGLEIRPLFLARWLVGSEMSAPWLDLFLDSFGLELGTFYEQPAGEMAGNRPGLQASLGLELPLLPRASGPWIGLHGGARWDDPTLGGESPSFFVVVTLAYHQILAAHLVDFADVAPR
jgi:hypothetical protein